MRTRVKGNATRIDEIGKSNIAINNKANQKNAYWTEPSKIGMKDGYQHLNTPVIDVRKVG